MQEQRERVQVYIDTELNSQRDVLIKRIHEQKDNYRSIRIIREKTLNVLNKPIE